MKKAIYTKDHKSIIKRLREARVSMGLEQKKVAEKLNKTQSYISKIECGQRRVDIVQLKKFAKIYKKSLDFFIN